MSVAVGEACLDLECLDELVLEYVEHVSHLQQAQQVTDANVELVNLSILLKEAVKRGDSASAIAHAECAAGKSKTLQDPRLMFALKKQHFVELMNAGNSSAALDYLRAELTPFALNAYPEAYQELSKVLLCLVQSPADTSSEGSTSWGIMQRDVLASVASLSLQIEAGFYAPKLQLMMTYLSLLHSRGGVRVDSVSEGAWNDLEDYTTHDRLPLPEYNGRSTRVIVQTCVQNLKQCLGLTHQQAKDSLCHTDGDQDAACKRELMRVQTKDDILRAAVIDYCQHRGLAPGALISKSISSHRQPPALPTTQTSTNNRPYEDRSRQASASRDTFSHPPSTGCTSSEQNRDSAPGQATQAGVETGRPVNVQSDQSSQLKPDLLMPVNLFPFQSSRPPGLASTVLSRGHGHSQDACREGRRRPPARGIFQRESGGAVAGHESEDDMDMDCDEPGFIRDGTVPILLPARLEISGFEQDPGAHHVHAQVGQFSGCTLCSVMDSDPVPTWNGGRQGPGTGGQVDSGGSVDIDRSVSAALDAAAWAQSLLSVVSEGNGPGIGDVLANRCESVLCRDMPIALTFDLRCLQFVLHVQRSELGEAQSIAKLYLGPMATHDVTFLPKLKVTMALLIASRDVSDNVSSLQRSVSEQILAHFNIQTPPPPRLQLTDMLEAGLHSHTAWFRRQQWQDPFMNMLSLDRLSKKNETVDHGVDAFTLQAGDTGGLSGSEGDDDQNYKDDDEGRDEGNVDQDDDFEAGMLQIMEILDLGPGVARDLLHRYFGDVQAAVASVLADD